MSESSRRNAAAHLGEAEVPLRLRRTGPGYEGEVAPFNPRDWLEVHPAPLTLPTT
ncbi:hypothetical protein [Nonomuraea candida]|uniref:hypothetical protein n=1 Tax=Nonomuraea candida TaxID=359159 RepID=UPI000ADBF88E|nr:hypothetical protein [Nonomuraea candida]